MSVVVRIRLRILVGQGFRNAPQPMPGSLGLHLCFPPRLSDRALRKGQQPMLRGPDADLRARTEAEFV
jgi:hypothetical protein